MNAILLVPGLELSEQPPPVGFPDHDDVVEELAADGPAETALEGHNDEDVEDLEPDRRHCKQVDRDDALGLVAKEGAEGAESESNEAEHRERVRSEGEPPRRP